MTELGRYDADLQMFVTEQPLDIERLRFLRWLVDQGRGEHAVAGPPSGDFVTFAQERIQHAGH